MKHSLGLEVKLSYAVGDFAANLLLQSISFFYLIYMTDVLGIDPFSAGLVMMISKLWDAITDPIMGTIVDHTHSRWGAKRPYILFGALPLAASFAMMFWNPGLVDAAKLPWALIAYILFNTAMTVVNIPYASLTVSITRDYAERSSLTSWRMALALVGTLIAAGATRILVDVLPFGGSNAWLVMALLYGLVSIAMNLITFAGVREVAREPAGFSIGEGFKAIGANRPFLIHIIGTFLIFICINMTAAAVSYFFRYNLALPGQESMGLAVLFVGAIVWLPLLNLLSRRIGKKEAYLISMAAFVVGLVLLFFFATSLVPTLLIFLLIAIGVSGVYLLPWSMLADTIEYSEWKTGVRPEGALYGIFFFLVKASAATALFLLGWGLELSGYQEAVKGMEQVQSTQAMAGIRLLMSLVPAAFVLVGSIVMSFYGINSQKHAAMVAEIEARKSGVSPDANF